MKIWSKESGRAILAAFAIVRFRHFQLPLFRREIRLFLVARRQRERREITTSARAVPSAAPVTRSPAPGSVSESPGIPAIATVLVGKIRNILKTTSSRHTTADRMLGVFISPVLCIMPPVSCRMSEKGIIMQ